MKVLYVSPNGYLGGAEKFVLNAVEAHQQRNSIDASILFYSQGEAVQIADRLKLKYHLLNHSFKLRNPFTLMKALLEIRKIIKKIDPDIIHSTMPYSHITISLAAIGLGIKKVWFQHGPVGGRLDQIANFFPVDEIFYNSSDLKTRHHLTKPRPRVRREETVIRMGVTLPLINHRILQNEMIVFGTAGRICAWKGFHNVISAFAKLKQDGLSKKYVFKIAGAAKTQQDKLYEQSLRKLTSDLNLNEEVIFLGHQEDMTDFFIDIDIFIHSSIIPEPFGLVVAEAMSFGCLVIGSKSGGVQDFLHQNSTGMTFESTRDSAVDELADCLKTIVSAHNLQKLQEIAENGQKYIRDHHSTEKMMDQIEERYRLI